MSSNDSESPGEEFASFVAKLEKYAAALNDREREVLGILLLAAMDPLDRLDWITASTKFKPEEARLLQELANKYNC